MRSSFIGLGVGLLGAIVLVYLLIVVNFQSWLDPFIIISALPGALAGICWFLLLTHTTLSVPSLTGSVMCMGVATANSILMVSFAREQMDEGMAAIPAAIAAGYTRMRPVLMTALAMIIGMVPMALGLGEGGEQNAPLGRAVIGGLLFATVATLFFVPSVFAIFHGRREARRARLGSRRKQFPKSESGMSAENEPEAASTRRGASQTHEAPSAITDPGRARRGDRGDPAALQASASGHRAPARAAAGAAAQGASDGRRGPAGVARRRSAHPAAALQPQPRPGPGDRAERRAARSPWCIRWRKSPTWNWCCPALCRPSRNRPSTPAPTATCCAGTRTLAAG